MELVYQRCCGVDVHKKMIVACLIIVTESGERKKEIRSFRTVTGELLQFLDWLQAAGCTHVAMESTGVYWKPIYNILEGHFELLVVNAQHIKAVPGRKTDVRDAEWIADLLQHGLLRGSYIPEAHQRELRELTRYRSSLTAERSRAVNRLQKTLEDTNLKLGDVATDIMGKSARAMLEALLAGQTDPVVLADLALGRLKAKRAQLQEALVGTIKPHHRFLLTELLMHIDTLDDAIARVSDEIDQRLNPLPDPSGDSVPPKPAPVSLPPSSKEAPNGTLVRASEDREPHPEPPSDLVGHPVLSTKEPLPPSPDPKDGDLDPPTQKHVLSWKEAVDLLDSIPGINERAAQGILAEIGIDMSRFPTASHLASWAGMSPGNHESAGKRLSGKTRKGNPSLRRLLVEAAQAAAHGKNTYLSALYHRFKARMGPKKAMIAVGHAILVIIYHLLDRQVSYQDLGGNYFDEHARQAVEQRLVRRLEKLGYRVELQEVAQVA